MMILALVTFPNVAYAQTLHERTLYELAKQTSGLHDTAQIDLGHPPQSIAVDEDTNTVYVANEFSNSVSVISGENHTRIGEFLHVGVTPAAIAVNEDTNTVYVAHHSSNGTSVISVISGKNYTKIGEDIPVRDEVASIGIDTSLNTIYIANSLSASISVISGKNYTKIGEDIPVGAGPIDIAVNEDTDAIYIANSLSASISVIDGVDNNVVAGVTFNVYPPNSGSVECDGSSTRYVRERYFYVDSGGQCIAKPNAGSEFVSWEENFMDNSTHLTNQSADATSFHTISEWLHLNWFEPEPDARLTITKFGAFTATFKALPPSIPLEYQTLFASALLAILTGILINRYRPKGKVNEK
jgi:YVTN family beta-propeller protein